LVFNAPRLALINVQTLKMSFPVAVDGTHFASAAYTFSPNFRGVLYQGETTAGEGLFIAPIELPQE
jgi:hypothetical protein